MPVHEVWYLNETFTTVKGLAEKDLGLPKRSNAQAEAPTSSPSPKNGVEDIGLDRGSEIAFNIQPDNTLTLVPRKNHGKRR